MTDTIISQATHRFGNLLVNLEAMPDEPDAWATLATDVREDQVDARRRQSLAGGLDAVEHDGVLLPVKNVRRWKFDPKSTETVTVYRRDDGGTYTEREPA